MLENLTAFTVAISKRASDYLLAFGAVGALTMALIQTVKESTPLRAWFHRRELRRWPNPRSHTGHVADSPPDSADELADRSNLRGEKRTRPKSDRRRGDVDQVAPSNPFRRGTAAADAPNNGAESCRSQLIALATAGNAAALYALEVEKLAGQLNAAAVIVADFPKQHPELCSASHGMPMLEISNACSPMIHRPMLIRTSSRRGALHGPSTLSVSCA
jgi:hypothetical protein